MGLDIHPSLPGFSTPYDAGAFGSGTLAFDFAYGALQKAAYSAASTVAVPVNGTAGASLTLWLTATSGTASARNLNFHASILKPTDSGMTFPKTDVAQNKTYIVKLVHNGTAWMLVSLIGGY